MSIKQIKFREIQADPSFPFLQRLRVKWAIAAEAVWRFLLVWQERTWSEKTVLQIQALLGKLELSSQRENGWGLLAEPNYTSKFPAKILPGSPSQVHISFYFKI